MKKLLFISTTILFLTGCQRGCQQMSKEFQASKRNYIIEQYSGGQLIKTHKFRGILTDAEHSDGYYWFAKDSMYEVSGDLIIKSWN